MKFLRSFFIIFAFICTSSASAQSVTTAFSQMPFTDVPTTDVHFQAIEFLRAQNIIKGYTDGTFKPNSRINRAEFVEFLINPFIVDINGKGDCVTKNIALHSQTVFFTDVAKDSWYANNVCFAKVKNIIDGYPDNTFRPAESINFVEAAKVIANVFSIQLESYQVGEFWYAPYLQRLSDLHAIPTSITNVNQVITRGEMAEIVYRLKVDSMTKSYMSFNATTHTLIPHAATSIKVTIKKPVATVDQVSIPNARSIQNAAALRNATRK